MMLAFAACCLMAVAGCQTSPAVTEPCDVLERLEPSRDTARYIVQNDRSFAQGVAIHRGRYQRYGCAKK